MARRRKKTRKRRSVNRAPLIIVATLIVIFATGLKLIDSLEKAPSATPAEPEATSFAEPEGTSSVEPVSGSTTEGENKGKPDEIEYLPEDAVEVLAEEANKSVETADQGSSEAGLLPVLSRAKYVDNQVALTIDDCNQTDNVLKILDIADEYDFKLTFFPIGNVVAKKPEVFKEVYDRGHEIENHSYSHEVMTELNDEEAIREIVRQNEAVNRALNMKYEMRMFRPPTGAGMKSEWLHGLLKDLNYQALASWGLSGTQNPDETLKSLRPGDIILFHATDKDLARLEYFIPKAIEKGFKFVTINELYNKDVNLTSPLT